MSKPGPKPGPMSWYAIRHAGFAFRYRLFTVETVGEGLPVEVPVDLAGYAARFMVRADPGEASTLLGTMDSQATPPTITFSASGVHGATVDTIAGGLPDTLTGLIAAGRAWGDIRMIPPAGSGLDAWYLFRGPFVVEDSVTTP